MILKRFLSFILSFIVGLAYFLLYFIGYSLLVSTSWLSILENIYLILASISVIGFLMKDSLDERRIRKASPSIGPAWIEHSPLAIMVLLQLLISIILNIEYMILVKIILSILILVDIGWDISQHARSKSFYKK